MPAGVIPVCLVSYILPVIIHLYMYCRPGGRAEQYGLFRLQRLFQKSEEQQCQPEAQSGALGHLDSEALRQPQSETLRQPLLPDATQLHKDREAGLVNAGEGGVGQVPLWWEVTREVVVPVGVAVVGLGFSVGALWVAVQGFLTM